MMPAEQASRAARFKRLILPLALFGLLVAAHALAADLLDRAGLVERLLSPSGLDAIVALLAALVLFGLRLTLFFVAPGVTVAWCLLRLAGPRTPPSRDAQPRGDALRSSSAASPRSTP